MSNLVSFTTLKILMTQKYVKVITLNVRHDNVNLDENC